MEKEKIDDTGMENYYRYILEQLEYVEMITSLFSIRWEKEPMISREIAQKCNLLADKIKQNLEGI